MSKKLRIWITVLSALIIFVSIGVIVVSNIQNNLDDLVQTELEELDLTSIPDGTYYGEYTAFPVSVEVSVHVSMHEIVSIQILQHDNGQGSPAEAIVETVIDHQSIQVDAIAGATYSSFCILLAIQDALDLGDS
ncbi:MAG: FMN-binding protein [Firmicutes bacterium]|nr:FMN-binding protein [Bacillota bacterium]